MTRKTDADPDYVRERTGATEDLGRKYTAAAFVFGLVMAVLIVPDILTKPDPVAAPAFANVTDLPDPPIGHALMANWSQRGGEKGLTYMTFTVVDTGPKGPCYGIEGRPLPSS